jgi:hypothetical protein
MFVEQQFVRMCLERKPSKECSVKIKLIENAEFFEACT